MSSVGKDKRKVASVAVIHDGKMLWLLRADEKKLCLPGGKFEEGEEPLDAAVRELKEETGIEADPKALEFLGSENVSGTKLHVYSFKYEPKEKPEVDLTKDPDAEATGHHWFEELPSDGEQFVPQEKNVTLRLLGMQVQDLNKMAIKDIPPGKPHPDIEPTPEEKVYDYSHIFPGLTIRESGKHATGHHPKYLYANIRHNPQSFQEQSELDASLIPFRDLSGNMLSPDLHIDYAKVHPDWKGQGIGRKMYEAIMAHAMHHYGTKRVSGSTHSTLAQEAHRKLAEKHGFQGYNPQERTAGFRSERGPFDDRYGSYQYTIKSEGTLAKSQPEWRSKDGLKIPKVGTPARKQWDKDYYNRLLEVFAGGNKDRLKLVKVPVTPQLSGTNMAVNKDRLNLYTRMIGGGDKLPPAIVKRNGIGWHVVDGNHRAQAALNRGVPEMDAYELLDPPKIKKSEEPFKGLAEHVVGSLSDDLRKPKYKGHENNLAGHCYVASEALWHMLGGPESGWVPQTIRHENDTHWYLKHKDTGKILDVTAGQFKTKVPYDKGRGCGFLTKEPSKRAKELITRIKARQAQMNDPTLSKGIRWAYHGTDPANLESIRSKGLLSQVGHRLDNQKDPRVYFSPEHALASDYGDLQLRFPWPDNFQEFSGEDQAVSEYHTPTSIDPKHIQHWTGKGWEPLKNAPPVEPAGMKPPWLSKTENEVVDLPISDLLASRNSLFGAYGNVTAGRGSKTQGPIHVWRTSGGKNLLVDGHHRLVQHLLSGKHGGTVPAQVVGEGYSDYWAEPQPNDVALLNPKLKYGGVEDFTNKLGLQDAKKHGVVLKKGLPGALMAAGLMTAPMNTDVMKQPQPQVQQMAAQWTPDGLDPDLIPIAHLESSFGKNVNHAPNAKGEYHTAYGAVGMKPITAHEEYNKNQVLQKLYPNLKDPADFMKAFKTIPRFYNLLASTHFARMKNLHGSAAMAAYAWRHGHHAAIGATPEQMNSDLYVQKYRHLATQTGLQKAGKDDEFELEEALVKSIGSLKPGAEIGGPYSRGDSTYYDYSHLLGPVMKRNYKVVLSSTANKTYGGHHLIAKVFYRSPKLSEDQARDWTNWEPAGYLNVSHEDGILRPSVTQLWPQHRGKGLGKAMYLAAFKHGMHELKAHSVEGEEHSSMANKVHASIANDHGLTYNARKIGPEVGPNDGAYGDYRYRLK